MLVVSMRHFSISEDDFEKKTPAQRKNIVQKFMKAPVKKFSQAVQSSNDACNVVITTHRGKKTRSTQEKENCKNTNSV